MSPASNTVTADAPLRFARRLTQTVNQAWEDGSLLNGVTQITGELLKFWFQEPQTTNRTINFHAGQQQAILNAVYCHEILKAENTQHLYSALGSEASEGVDPQRLSKTKYQHPKYCLKMATGTGKTWVLSAFLIWQYLNARHETQKSGRFSKNFLLVAPGLIVYERLLDAFQGKENENGERDFEGSDFSKFQELFLPQACREEVFGFLKTSVARKEEIGRKITGDGLVAITNWHALVEQDEEDEDLTSTSNPLEDPSPAVREIFRLTPGTSQGHSLETLDQKYLRGGQLEYLASLESLVVFNEEAHHIHETKTAGIVSEVERQNSLNRLSEGKGARFTQIDFSATPYDVSGSGQNRVRHYFPHIIVDFNLATAMKLGLVKILTLDKRKEWAAEEIEFRALRDENNKITGLSEGQKLMLRAGLAKLNILEKEFTGFTADAQGRSGKHPKMLVVCEETGASDHVVKFLAAEGLPGDDVVRVDSDKKGSIPTREWESLKRRLFNADAHAAPKVIVSVLMLREGFDVNNICVIVPLRSSESAILLEQIVGRGLRLMWREKEYEENKAENRRLLLERKRDPQNYLDILSIVEHPNYLQFYNDLEDFTDLISETDELPEGREGVLGDIIKVGLKSNFKDYDLFWPQILHEREENIKVMETVTDYLAPFTAFNLDQLKRMAPPEGEVFFSEVVTVRTHFGEYRVSGQAINPTSYNDFLSKLIHMATQQLVQAGQRSSHVFPTLQVNQAHLAAYLDLFIRRRLFQQEFNPLEGNNWKVLMIARAGILEHLLRELSLAIYKTQNDIEVEEATVYRRYFSEVPELKMRENYSPVLTKTPYERLAYPSNKGELEHNFMLACDDDGKVEAFLKIGEPYHTFAHMNYIRTDGMLARYFPDFIVKTDEFIYLAETKAQSSLRDENVLQKQRGTLDWLKKVNALRSMDRDEREWAYSLIGENTFYNMRERGASIPEILAYGALKTQEVEGRLL